MGFRLLADLIVVLHAAFVLFVVAGAVLVARWPKLLPVHLGCVAWGAYTEFTGTVCPLTPLENHLRRLAGQSGYAGGFIEHYVIPVIYPAGLTPGIQLALGVLAVGVNVVAYTILWRRRHST
ncbi:MAG: DUF2784 domain-containing protein [Gemmatimonadota bacterium]|jgi:hypothetical protein|nr:DUF2784 domain-containing protein [Gemmatimonadota bacterium]